VSNCELVSLLTKSLCAQKYNEKQSSPFSGVINYAGLEQGSDADPVQWCHITGTVWTGKDTSSLVFPCEQSFSSTSSETVKRRQLAACSCRVLAGKKERLPIAAVEVAQVPIEQS